MRRDLAGAALTIAAVAVLACGADSEVDPPPVSAPADESVELTVYLSDEAGIQSDCAAVRAVAHSVPAAETDLPSAAVRRVIRDVVPSPGLQPPGTPPLREYFRGVRVEGATALVRFDGGALAYLNAAACAQAAVKTPIVRTLLEFPEVEAVAWVIDGEVFDAWDA